MIQIERVIATNTEFESRERFLLSHHQFDCTLSRDELVKLSVFLNDYLDALEEEELDAEELIDD